MKFTKIITVAISCIIVFKLTVLAQDIHQASQKGDLEEVRALLKKNPGLINMKNRYGMIPLHTAAYNGQKEIFDFFLSKGLYLKSTTDVGKTALFYAAINQQKEMVEYLKSKGLNKNFINFPVLKGAYLGQKKPGQKPDLFAPGIISTIGKQHGSMAITLDQNEIYWTEECSNAKINIYFMQNINGKWTPPKPAPFTIAQFHDGNPVFSAEGKWLYFISTRPTPEDSKSVNFHRWVVEKKPVGFGNPKMMNPLFQDGYQGGIASTRKGNHYFMTYYPNYEGKCDIYVSKLKNGKLKKPVIVDPSICGKYQELDFYIHPDEKYIIFCSDRPGGQGKSDLYISFKKSGERWSPPLNLGNKINSSASDRLPFVTADQKYLFFMSDRNDNQDYYWVDASIIEELKSKNL